MGIGRTLFGVAIAVGSMAGQGNPQRSRAQSAQPASPAPVEATAPGTAAVRRTLPDEKSSVTHHKSRVGGQEIGYTATAATYIVKAGDGTPKASFFFVAYTKDDVADIAKRPLSFIYNGGPGSGSLFTHMGLGPKRRFVSGRHRHGFHRRHFHRL